MKTYKLLWNVVVLAGLIVASGGCGTVSSSSQSAWWSDAYSPQAEEIPVGLKAKTITFYKLEEKFGECVKIPVDKYIVHYDKRNDQAAVDFLSADKKLIRRCIYEYNDQGQPISKTVYKLDEKYLYEYDAKGHKSRLVCYDAQDTLYYEKTYKYDDKSGKLVEVNYTEHKGVSVISHQYVYQYKDNQTEKSEYDSAGNLVRKVVYEDDPKGNRLKTTWYDGVGKLMRQMVYKYDRVGNRTESVFYRADGSLFERTVYQYDARRNKTLETVYRMKKKLGQLEEVPIRQITYEHQF